MPPAITEVDPQQIVEWDPDVDHITDGVELVPTVTIPPVDPSLQPVSEATCISESGTSLSQDVSDNGQNATGALMLPPSLQKTHVQGNSPIYMDQTSMLTEYDLAGNHCSLGLDLDPVSLHLASMENLDLLLNPHSQYEVMQGTLRAR